MEENREKKTPEINYPLLQCIFTGVCALCCLGVFAAVLVLLPRVLGIVSDAGSFLDSAAALTGQLEATDIKGLIANLESLSRELSEAELGSIASEVSEALGRINSIDLEKLNSAIGDLAEVVEPLANFFGRFG